MSIIVKGVDMPATCQDCCFTNGSDECFFLLADADIDGRYEDCPLKSVEGLIEKFERIAERSEDAYGYGSCVFSTSRIAEIIREYCEVSE